MGRLTSTATIAVVVLGLLALGTATATKLITGKDIRDHSITGRDIKRGSIPLSSLRAVPTPGAVGPQGPKGNPGVVGAIGPAGPPGLSALDRVGTLSGPIPASIAPSSSLEFVGNPAEVDLASAYRGVLEATVTVGVEGTAIDDPEKFALTMCVDQGAGPEALDESESEPFGVSPVLATGDRVSVTVSSGFFVSGEEEEIFTVLMGPCVLNDTTSPLDNNGRTVGYVLTAFPRL